MTGVIVDYQRCCGIAVSDTLQSGLYTNIELRYSEMADNKNISHLMKWCVFISCLFNSVIALAQEVRDSIPAAVHNWRARYVTFLPESQFDSTSVYADTDIVPMIYKVNKWDYHPGTKADSVCRVIEDVIHDPSVRLAYVWVGGSASPEGPIRWNKTLGERRANVLADYLLAHTSLQRRQLRVENLEEDWASVVRTLQRIDFPHREEIIAIIKAEPNRLRRKQKINAIDGGRTWQKLIREVFPPLRNARMAIICYPEIFEPDSKAVDSLPIPSLIPETQLALPTIVPRIYPTVPESRFFALKTNALFLAALCANLGFEVELWPKWSLDVPVWYSPYDIVRPTRKIRLLATQPEIRYWMKKAGEGHFFGLHTHVVGFNIAINDNGRYQDPNHALWGMGLSYGFALHLDKAKHWGLEFNIGAGFAEYDYDVYHNRRNGQKFRSGSAVYYGITRAGITLSYKWYKQRKYRKWMQW